MLTCIACSKHLSCGGGTLPEQSEDDVNTSTPSTKQAIKALTAQIKCMAVKATDAYKQCKPCSGSMRNKRNRDEMDSDAGSVSEMFYCSYRRTGSSNSTPRFWGKDAEARLNSLLSGSSTPVSFSSRTESVVFVEENEPKEWVAQVEPGVLITFISLPRTGNHLKRIRFSREIFNKWQAQRWWEENHDNVMELYNVQEFNHHAVPLPTQSRSGDENSIVDSAKDNPPLTPSSREHHTPELYPSKGTANKETSFPDGSAQSSPTVPREYSGDLSERDAFNMETEWVEQDEPGVYITIKILESGARELKRVRFSRERFGEIQARLWWEENRARVQNQYLYLANI